MLSESPTLTPTSPAKKVHWETFSSWWKYVDAPLRPSEEDTAFLTEAVLPKLRRDTHTGSDTRTVVLLGVTPELALLPWPENTKLLAVDQSTAMIDNVWPCEDMADREAIAGDWKHLPLADNACDLVLGDGCFTLLNYASDYEAVLKEICRVLKPGGLLSMRFFLNASPSEQVSVVFEDFHAGAIGSFHAFKWRLAMALQVSVREGIPVRQVWDTWCQEVSTPTATLQSLGWPHELLATIQAYEGSACVYTFPTLMEVRQRFSDWFDEEICFSPNYELGDRCSTLLFRVKNKC